MRGIAGCFLSLVLLVPGLVRAQETPAPSSSSIERTETLFNQFDRDQDGVIELEEDFEGLEMMLDQFGAALRAMDLDGDGRITRDEFFGRGDRPSRWLAYVAVVAALAGIAGVSLVVDGVLDKDRRQHLLYGAIALAAGGAILWLTARDTLQSMLPTLGLSALIMLGTLLVAVALGKPVEEEPIEPFTPAGTAQKRYVIGRGGQTLSQPPSRPAATSRRPARPPRRPRRPPSR